MELKTNNGMSLIGENDIAKLKEISKYIPTVRNSIFKTAFHIKKLDEMLQIAFPQEKNNSVPLTK